MALGPRPRPSAAEQRSHDAPGTDGRPSCRFDALRRRSPGAARAPDQPPGRDDRLGQEVARALRLPGPHGRRARGGREPAGQRSRRDRDRRRDRPRLGRDRPSGPPCASCPAGPRCPCSPSARPTRTRGAPCWRAAPTWCAARWNGRCSASAPSRLVEAYRTTRELQSTRSELDLPAAAQPDSRPRRSRVAARPADGPAAAACVRAGARVGARRQRRLGPAAGVPLPRPRPLQAHQRHLRAPGRQPGAGAGGRAPARVPARPRPAAHRAAPAWRRPPSPAWAATRSA